MVCSPTLSPNREPDADSDYFCRMKKNRNRSQKRRGVGRRPASNSRDTSLEASSDDFNDEDDADYHD